MLAEPKCFTRRCRWYSGIAQPDGTEASERPVCPAYPDGIPDDIAYGDGAHLSVRPDQQGTFVFEATLAKSPAQPDVLDFD